MRHSVYGKKLSRDVNSRKALLDNLASAVIVSGKVTTTIAKAKFARSHIEKLVTTVKKNKLASNRIMASSLSRSAFLKLKNEIGPGFENRSGGYTRIVRLSARRGDNSQMARLELVEWEKTKPQTSKSKVDPEAKVAKKTNLKKEKAPKTRIKKALKTTKPKSKK